MARPDPSPDHSPDPAPGPQRRRGRRPAGEDTRAQILAAARTEFTERGYEAVTLRGIARSAGVDARLVHHYFGGKEEIFVAALDFPVLPSQVVPAAFGGHREGLGERVARVFLSAWETPQGRSQVIALLGAGLASEQIARVLREFITREILVRAVAGAGAEDPELRATLVASHMVGVAVLRHVLKVEPMASADVEDLVAVIAPTLQRYLTGELVPGEAPGPDTP
ncbi:MAG: TetR family transcriptional regulator [Kineosporiaceae bacterium]|jgi:AcrR family transcriptional regulator